MFKKGFGFTAEGQGLLNSPSAVPHSEDEEEDMSGYVSDDDCFCIAQFSALEQTHCTCV